MKMILPLLILISISTQTYAQKNSENYLGAWYTIGFNHRFSNHFSITPYAELRVYEPTSNYNLTFLSLNANYHFKHHQTISLAYAYLDIDSVFDTDVNPNTIEHRTLQQYAKQHQLKLLNIQHRFRLEQRFLKFPDKNKLENRLRYRLRLNYKINKTLFFALTEEAFVNFQDQVFHENRFYIGLGFYLLKHTQLQIGYLKHHIKKNNLNRLQIGISIQTDARKSKAK